MSAGKNERCEWFLLSFDTPTDQQTGSLHFDGCHGKVMMDSSPLRGRVTAEWVEVRVICAPEFEIIRAGISEPCLPGARVRTRARGARTSIDNFLAPLQLAIFAFF